MSTTSFISVQRLHECPQCGAHGALMDVQICDGFTLEVFDHKGCSGPCDILVRFKDGIVTPMAEWLIATLHRDEPREAIEDYWRGTAKATGNENSERMDAKLVAAQALEAV